MPLRSTGSGARGGRGPLTGGPPGVWPGTGRPRMTPIFPIPPPASRFGRPLHSGRLIEAEANCGLIGEIRLPFTRSAKSPVATVTAEFLGG